jgi:hypothetical protein
MIGGTFASLKGAKGGKEIPVHTEKAIMAGLLVLVRTLAGKLPVPKARRPSKRPHDGVVALWIRLRAVAGFSASGLAPVRWRL